MPVGLPDVWNFGLEVMNIYEVAFYQAAPDHDRFDWWPHRRNCAGDCPAYFLNSREK